VSARRIIPLTLAQEKADATWREVRDAAQAGDNDARAALLLANMPTDGDSLFGWARGHGVGR
jgi:hypothetical protein